VGVEVLPTRRVQTKRTVRDVRTEKEQLAEENAELRSRLSGSEPYPPTTEDVGPADGAGTKHGVFDR
jgi:hypothetical protein